MLGLAWLEPGVRHTYIGTNLTLTYYLYLSNSAASAPAFSLSVIMSSISSRRLSKELSEIKSEGCPVGVSLSPHPSAIQCLIDPAASSGINLLKADDFQTWFFTIEVKGDSLYEVSSVYLFSLIS